MSEECIKELLDLELQKMKQEIIEEQIQVNCDLFHIY